MNAAEREPDGAGFKIAFRAIPTGLRAHVVGTSSLETTVASWRAILVEVRKRRPDVLLLIDELRGPALVAAQ